MGKIKVIKLDENEQKQLFCIALHLSNFLEDKKDLRWDYKSEIPADKLDNEKFDMAIKTHTACEFCTRYSKECAKLISEGKPTYYDPKILTKLTGVYFSAAIGQRDAIRDGKGNFHFFK
jgi:hypothetical protein